MQEHFPLFAGYIGVSVLVSLSRLVIFHYHYVRYFVYWASESLLILLSIAALNQVFWYTYKGFKFIWWFRPLYYGAIAVALGITIRMAIVSPTVQAHPILSFIVDAEIAANVVRSGIVALFEAMVKPWLFAFRDIHSASSLASVSLALCRSLLSSQFTFLEQNMNTQPEFFPVCRILLR